MFKFKSSELFIHLGLTVLINWHGSMLNYCALVTTLQDEDSNKLINKIIFY